MTISRQAFPRCIHRMLTMLMNMPRCVSNLAASLSPLINPDRRSPTEHNTTRPFRTRHADRSQPRSADPRRSQQRITPRRPPRPSRRRPSAPSLRPDPRQGPRLAPRVASRLQASLLDVFKHGLASALRYSRERANSNSLTCRFFVLLATWSSTPACPGFAPRRTSLPSGGGLRGRLPAPGLAIHRPE